MKLSSQRFLLRLMVYGIMLGTIPVIAVGMISYSIAADKIRDMAINSSSHILLQTEQRVEQTFKTLDTAVTQFISSPDTSTAFSVDLYNLDFQSVKRFELLVSRMHHLQTFEFGVHDVYLIHSDNRWLIRNDGTYPLERLEPGDMEQVRMYTSLPKQSQWIYDRYVVPEKASGRDESTSYASSQYDGGISLVKKFSSGQGTIVVKISTGELQKQLLKSNELGNVLMYDDSFDLIAYQEGNGIMDTVQTEAWMNRLKRLPDHAGYYETEVGGSESIVSYRKSDYSGIVYVSITSIRTIAQETAGIKTVTVIVCAIVLALILIGTFIGSRRMYSPIRRLYNIVVGDGGERAGTPRGSDELQRIGDRIVDVLKSNVSKDEQLGIQQIQLMDFVALRLCLGEVNERELRSKLSMLAGASSWRLNSVTAIQIDSLADTLYEEKDLDLLLFAVSNMITELVPSDRRLRPLLVDQTCVLISGSMDTDPGAYKSELYAWVEAIQQAVNHYLRLKVGIGISRFYDKLLDTHAAYQQSLDALKYRASLGQQSILFIGDMYPELSAARKHSPLMENGLFDAIKSGDTEKSHQLLEQVLNQAEQEQLPPFEVQMLLLRLVSNTIRIVQDAGITPSVIYGEQPVFDQLLKLKSMREVRLWLKDHVVGPALNELEAHRETQFRKISDDVIRIIHERYDQELLLDMCAAEINYNPHYVSRVFRHETGMTFSEYVSQYRLSVARSWLSDTEMKVGEIAEKLQFATTANFIRHFRKIEGITPGEYRKNRMAALQGQNH